MKLQLSSLPLGFVSLAFYKYHKVPSKIFPGDSGALTLGAMYGAIAIVGWCRNYCCSSITSCSN